MMKNYHLNKRRFDYKMARNLSIEFVAKTASVKWFF